jgi:hypothetical protein
MKFFAYLKEEYLSRTYDYEIFVNPSPKELASIEGRPIEVRFFVNFKKKVIVVWDAKLLHMSLLNNNEQVQKVVGIKNYAEWAKSDEIFSGYGTVRNGKITSLESDGIDVYAGYEDYYRKINDTWTTAYFPEPLTDMILAMI